MTKRKEKIIKIALNEILSKGIENVTIDSVAQKAGLKEELIHHYFNRGDDKLRLDAVEYAGVQWVSEIEKEIKTKENLRDKITVLTCEYTLGSKDYSASLSTYIDLWKIIKDGKNEYVKNRLGTVYHFYINKFMDIAEKEIKASGIPEEKLRSFATFMTILSDVLHIQSVVLENKIDFESIGKVITKIALQFLSGDAHE